jgi:heavy metal translocating P-type ATPase
MHVMRESEQRRPQLRRLGDQLGAFYTPLALIVAGGAWIGSGDPVRFLAVLVIATPCPLLIAIPVAIIGAVSLSARRGIIIKDPAALERLDSCRVVIFDKTGTLTYGRPVLTDVLPASGIGADDLLVLVAGLERYSKHPLASAVLDAAAARSLPLAEAAEMQERPGEGLTGVVHGRRVLVTNRHIASTLSPDDVAHLPPPASGMECVVLADGRYAGTLRFRDEPRRDSPPFIRHLGVRHRVSRVMLVSGDRESEVRYLAETVGITELRAGQTPEQKLALVREETRRAPTLFVGDGINDAPALTAATVGVAFGQTSDITSEAAGVVILDNSLGKVDELLHISHRMRVVALQSAMGGMALSVAGMILAAGGGLSPVAGALTQEVIDLLAVVNALRAAWPPKTLTDY